MFDHDELLSEIDAAVANLQERYSLSNVGKAFLMWYATVELDLGVEEAEEAVGYDGGNDKSIDFFYVDEEHRRVIIAQGKFNRKGTYRADEGEFLKLVHTTDWLANPETFRNSGRPDLADAAEDYRAALDRGYSTEFHYVYMGPAHRDVELPPFGGHSIIGHNAHEEVFPCPVPSRPTRLSSKPKRCASSAAATAP